jgi:hypothetical protein
VSRDSGRRVFDALERRLAGLAVRQPGLALSASAALGRLRNRLSRRWPDPEQVRTLFPHLGAREAARVAWKIGGLEARNRILAQCIRRAGIGPVRHLVRTPPAVTALRPPLILGTFHVGAVHGLGPALERLSAPVVAFRHGPLFAATPRLELVTTEGDEQRRAAAFYRALAHLEGGGFVALALDVVPGPGLPVSCLGRTIELARGPFALARLTGAPLVPFVGRWQRGGIEIGIGEVLSPASPACESDLAAAAARWLERYLLDAPSELELGLLRTLLAGDLTETPRGR